MAFLRNLFRYLVMGDAEAAEREKKELLGLHAFNRTLYANTSAAQGYAGTDELYSASIFGHSAVIVDDALPHTVDEMFPLAGSNEGLYKQGKDEILPGRVHTRTHFGPHAKFASVRATNVYDEVAMTRALVLTRQYLFDAVSVQSPRPRRYLWQVQAIGLACPAEPGLWSPSEWLYHNHPSLQREVSRIAGDRPWGVTFWQETGGVEPREGIVGPRWYERRPGVRLSMLGDPDTIACYGLLPLIKQMSYDQPRDRIVQGRTEPGSSVAAALRCNRRNTCFAALHEPYDGALSDTAFTVLAVSSDIEIAPAAVDLGGFAVGAEKSVKVRFRVRAGVARHETWRLTPGGDGIELQNATLVLGRHVAAWRNWHGPIENDLQVVAPRYHAKLYPRMSGGFAVMIDPDGHRVDMNGGICPRLTAFSARVDAPTGKTNEVPETIELGRYTQMFPKAYSEKARQAGWIEERDQWQHEGAPFKYRFEADWIALQYYQPRPEHRACSVEWWPLGSVYRTPDKGHGKAYVAGRIEDLPVGHWQRRAGPSLRSRAAVPGRHLPEARRPPPRICAVLSVRDCLRGRTQPVAAPTGPGLVRDGFLPSRGVRVARGPLGGGARHIWKWNSGMALY